MVSYYHSNTIEDIDPIMCNLKRHLFKLAALFSIKVSEDEKLFEFLREGCLVKTNRFKLDEELDKVLKSPKNSYSFSELKKIKDDFSEEFQKIKMSYLE